MTNEGRNNTGYGNGGDKIEDLRSILEHEQCRPVSYQEANEIGESLISYFEVLADNSFAEQQAIVGSAK